MSQISLEEKYVVVPPRSTSRLGVDATLTTSPPVDDRRADYKQSTVRAGRRALELLRAIGSATVWTLRAVGALLGIAAAAISVGVLVVIQRVLHLG